MKIKHLSYDFLFIVILLLHISCGNNTPTSSENSPEIVGYHYTIPEQLNDGWETAHLDSVGIDSILIIDMVNHFYDDGEPYLKSLLIARSGNLVFERYFNGEHRDSLHLINSCTKSFTSALIGIAMDQGLITSVNESLYSFFPNYDSLRTTQKDSILLYHALSMTDGMDWDEWSVPYDRPGNDFYHMHRYHTYYVEYILSKGVDVPPGTRWRYNSSMSVLLGQIIRNVSGLYADQFAEQFLFQPLGIESYNWWSDWRGRPWTHFGLHLRPRDFIKLGQLYLNEGTWNGQRILSSKWVDESIVRRAAAAMWGVSYGYGYQWWLKELVINNNNIKYYFASGDGGQMIIVVPELEMVATFTMDRPEDNGANFILDLLTHYIFPSAH